MKRAHFLAAVVLAGVPVGAAAQGRSTLPPGALRFQRVDAGPYGWLNAPVFVIAPARYWSVPVFIVNGNTGGIVKSNFESTDWDVIEEAGNFNTFSANEYNLLLWVQNGVTYVGWETTPYGFVQKTFFTPLQFHHLPKLKRP